MLGVLYNLSILCNALALHNMNCIMLRAFLMPIMCLSPISIPNPNYGLSHLKYVNTERVYIRVPCGYCSECIARKQMAVCQRVQMESLVNHLYFCTLTYNDDTLPKVTTSQGITIPYADISHLQNMFKRLRKSLDFPIRYFACSERGSKTGRPHFHLILSVPKTLFPSFLDAVSLESYLYDKILSEWRVNVSSTRSPRYVNLCSFYKFYRYGRLNTTYDFHYLNDSLSQGGCADVAFYVSKYMYKVDDRVKRLQQALKLNYDIDEYEEIWKKVKPRFLYSKHYGLDYKDSTLIKDYIRNCIISSYGSDFPTFINPVSGQKFPLAHYYKTRFLNIDDAKHFKIFNEEIFYEDLDYTQLLNKLKKHEKVKNQISCYDAFDSFDCFDTL